MEMIIRQFVEKHEKEKDKLADEFKDIQTTDEKRREHNGHDYETTVAEERKNFEKNRYTDILPYDRNRVGLPNERYINASMIVHPRVSAPSFICTQGPKPNTVGDFWEMVAIKKARVIVMLCKFDEEDGQKKCHKYWCDDRKRCEASPHRRMAYVESEVTTKSYVKRQMVLMNRASAKCHRLQHFQFKGWPDHGVPENDEMLIEFLKQVQQAQDADAEKPLVVHCSGGVGRTGTFVSLYVIKQLIDKNELRASDLDIKNLVLTLRAQRVSMVQTEEQYIFLHRAVVKLCQNYKK